MTTQIIHRLGVSSDTFRRAFAPLPDEVKEDVKAIKGKADELLALIEAAYQGAQSRNWIADARCFATAQTNLETSVMFAVKGLTS